MKLRKLSAVMMAAILATSSPVSSYLGEITAFAKKDEDEDEKDYSIGDASWDTTEDSDGKTHVYATWSEASDKSTGTITIFVDGKNRTSEASSGSINASTTSGKKDMTSYIKKINRKGEYTFKITAGKKNKGDTEKSYSESDVLEVDSDFLKSLASSSSSGASEVPSSSSSSGSTSGPGSTPASGSTSSSGSTPASGSSPASAMNGGSQNAAQESTAADQWQFWTYGYVYLENGIPVTNRWVLDNGKYYHLGANGFMDTNTYVNDELGSHYVGADGALMF